MIDERRDDGLDNDGDWTPYTDLDNNGEWDAGEPLNDDLGKDGVGPFDRQYNGPDDGEADSQPTPGEPDFDRTDKDESDQIGLTSMSIYRLIDGGGGNAWPLPLNFRIGVVYHALQTENHQAVIEVDAQHPNNNYESINLGFEYVLLRHYAIRGGYKTLFLQDSQKSFTLGAGLNYPIFGNIMIHIDYAFADFGILDNVHKFSLGLDF